MLWYLAWLSAFVFLIQLIPPKRGAHSKAAQTVANATYHFLSGRCGRQGQPSFGSSVLALADMPGVTEALGFENGTTSADVVVGAKLLNNMKASFQNELSSNSQRTTEGRRITEATASTMYSPGMNQAAVERMTGISSHIFSRGGQLKSANLSADRTQASSSLPVSKNEHAYPLKEVWAWYHGEDCAKVQIDKQTKRQYSRKIFVLPNGEDIHLDCVLHTKFCDRTTLAQSYMDSERHRELMQEDPKRKLTLKTAQECICDCIKDAKIHECLCPVCTGFRMKLQGWKKMRDEARKTENCDCPECVDGSAYRRASESSSDWRVSSTCGKVAHPGLENPADGLTPQLNLLRCSLLPRVMTARRKQELGAADGTADYYPYYAGGPCPECGWDSFAPADCPVEMNPEKTCTWTEKQEGMGPKGEAIYCSKTGTRRELMAAIKAEGAVFNNHMWLVQWNDLQARLDNETFYGETEIVIVSDWAATYSMSQHDVEKCSFGTTCNQYVALVLHSPQPRPEQGGGSRKVQCDVWRSWSQAKGAANWHQAVLREIVKYYKKGPVPRLARAKVKTDGQRSQYKGQRNLGATAELPHPDLSPETVQLCALL